MKIIVIIIIIIMIIIYIYILCIIPMISIEFPQIQNIDKTRHTCFFVLRLRACFAWRISGDHEDPIAWNSGAGALELTLRT